MPSKKKEELKFTEFNDKRAGKETRFLSLIVPVFKQEKTSVANIRALKTVMDTIGDNYEIIVVVDGLGDPSYEKIKKARMPKVICITYPLHQGKGFALRQGMNKALGDYVLFIDSGMEIDPGGIRMLLEHLLWYEADIIVGSKRHPASIINYPLSRKILSLAYYFLVKALFGIKVHDTQAGIKIFKRKVLEKILPHLVEKKFAGDLEMLVVANHFGFTRIYEAPIRLDYGLASVTSAATIHSILGILVDTFAIFYRLHIVNYYDSLPDSTASGNPD